MNTNEDMLDPIIVIPEPDPIIPVNPVAFPTIDPITEIQRQNYYYFSRRIAYDSRKIISYSGLKNAAYDVDKKLKEIESNTISFTSAYVVLDDLDKLAKFYAEWMTKEELEKVKSLRVLIFNYQNRLNDLRNTYLEKEQIAQKAENDNKPRFGLTKVHPKDWDLILSITGSARLWLHYVSKYKIEEINSKQEFIDELILLNDCLSELSRYSRKLHSKLEIELERHLQKNNNILLLDRNEPVTSFDMMKHYWSGKGNAVTLQQLGLFEKVKSLVKTPNQLGKQNGHSVQGDFIQQIIKNNRKSFRNTYSFRQNVGALAINNPLWAIGGAIIEGQFSGNAVSENGKFYLKGEISYKFYDKFTDPYDTFNLIPGEWNPDGDSYDINGKWTEPVSVEISQTDYLNLKQ
ncbi:hypothetical protein [Gallibacterium anatis]|uniref:hypothetical protein n=1 Tax=Gallibacterium anatis TaxID=750 RepID=UPI001B324C6F|nr:hypothetical protein [Gallibacterium anatis]MBP4134426.1 hypothetical protein [Gallibacterium anatis]